MSAIDVLSPTAALAEGLREHLRGWAQALGAQDPHARAAGDAAALASLATSEGHVCVLLEEIGPDIRAIRESLLASRVVGTPAAPASLPLVLDDDGRLYLHRYFDYERRLAQRLVSAASQGESGLSIVSGGPGTGKTTRIVGELARLLEAEPGLRVSLAAPTGKAAARMIAAIRERADQLPAAVRGLLPHEAFTIHRLLGYNPSSGFEHGRDNPLALDVLIVDEASMLDVALATRLLEAVPPGARIVLLGDKDQLAAVESGAVFAEISSDAQRLPVTLLTRNWRFPEDSGIGRLAADVRRGDADAALAWLRSNADPAVRWEAAGSAVALAQRGYQAYFDALRRDAGDKDGIEAAFASFRVLCAVREGPHGVEAFNRELSTHARALLQVHGPGEWYAGRPVMVLVNDYAMKLFNGDVGIALPDGDGTLKVWFREGDGWRAVPPARVPRHETAYAMTVHKSQGSEFANVLLVLPPSESRVLSRELLYTGITRARSGVVLHGGEGALRAAIERATQRRSGLLARLREAAAAAA